MRRGLTISTSICTHSWTILGSWGLVNIPTQALENFASSKSDSRSFHTSRRSTVIELPSVKKMAATPRQSHLVSSTTSCSIPVSEVMVQFPISLSRPFICDFEISQSRRSLNCPNSLLQMCSRLNVGSPPVESWSGRLWWFYQKVPLPHSRTQFLVTCATTNALWVWLMLRISWKQLQKLYRWTGRFHNWQGKFCDIRDTTRRRCYGIICIREAVYGTKSFLSKESDTSWSYRVHISPTM